MTELYELLERRARTYRPSPDLHDRVLERAHRRDRNRRAGAGVVGAVVLIALAIVLWESFRPQTPQPADRPSPSETNASLEPRTLASLGFLAARAAYPRGWETRASPGEFFLGPASGPGRTGIVVMSDPWLVTEGCSSAPQSTEELVAALLVNPALALDDQRRITVGGLEGVQLDFATASGARLTSCDGLAQVPLLTAHQDSSADPFDDRRWGLTPSQRMRVYVLQASGTPRSTIVIIVLADRVEFDRVAKQAARVVEQFRFDA